MVGEFHRHNLTPGLHNSEFFPLRTNLPAIAIRHMAPSDIVFLKDNPDHLQAYENVYGPVVPGGNEGGGGVI